MKQRIENLNCGSTPFCIIQKQDSEDILFLTGTSSSCRAINEIPRKHGDTNGKRLIDSISVIPFCQIRERGYRVRDQGERILTIQVDFQYEVDVEHLLELLPSEEVGMTEDISYDTTEAEYERVIEDIVQREIGNGEGANFVIPRNGQGKISDFSVAKALTIFRSLIENDYGTYWKFIFYDTERFFIGSTPERHLCVEGGRVKMNPISGTFRKDRKWGRRKEFKKDLLRFLTDQKEINELFMVVDEELKMMAKMCDHGGAIIGPRLKEMSQLIHSEYLLSGESNKDIFELFTDSMFAATVVGSPVENACNVIAKYSGTSRRYYGSALMLVGRDKEGRDFLDSPITIRTAEVALDGTMHLSVGATLVKDSIAHEELAETRAKGAAIISSIVATGTKVVHPSMLPSVLNDDEIIETMVERNQDLSNFWFFKQERTFLDPKRAEPLSITIIHNGDDFAYMLRHMFSCMGMTSTIVRYANYDIELDSGDITLLGPGPGNPNDQESTKIKINRRITEGLLSRKKKALFVCLGHQVLCRCLGFKIQRKENPLQGSQVKINLFGRDELVGFYNTFAPIVMGQKPYEMAVIPELDELVAIRGESFAGLQFHPESLLTKNGYTILEDTLKYLLGQNR